jgi:hypothetical protein
MRWYLLRNRALRVFSRMLAMTLTAISSAVVAQQAPQDKRELDEIVVVGVTPVPGFKVDKDKIPGNIQTLRSSDLTRNGAAGVLGALDQQVGSATVSGGSFNQRQAQAEYGVNDGPLGAYVAVNSLKEGGWRHFAQDRIRQYYLDLSFHTDAIISDLSYSRGNNRLFGQGPAPAQSTIC